MVRVRCTCYSPILSIEIVIPDRDVPYGGSKKYFATFLLVLTFSAWVFSPWTAHAASGAQILLCSRRAFFVSFFLCLSLSLSLSPLPLSPCCFFLLSSTREICQKRLCFFLTNRPCEQINVTSRSRYVTTAKLNTSLLFFHSANLRSLIITMCENGP